MKKSILGVLSSTCGLTDLETFAAVTAKNLGKSPLGSTIYQEILT